MFTTLRKVPLYLSARIEAYKRESAPFYRLHPYTGTLPLKGVDRRGMVSIEHGFFFNRIPKAANSTVAVALAKACGATECGGQDGSWAKELFARPSQLSWSQLSVFEEVFKFTFVRSPYTRTLSAYLDKIRTGEKMLGGESWTFSDFCHYLDGGGLFGNAHWAPQAALLILPPERFDFIGRVETLDADMRTAFLTLGFPVPKKFNRAGPPATKASELASEHYTAECREIVARLYRTDFETFGYEV